MERPSSRPRSGWGRLATAFARIASDRVRALSLLEQGMISGANFTALLLLARGFDSDTFGTFSFAWLSMLFVLNIHRSAVVVPFVIHTAHPGVLEAESPAWRRLNHWTTALAAMALGAVALALPHFSAPGWMDKAFLMAALFVIPCFAYEFRRRWLIQQDRYGSAVAAAAVYLALWLGCVAAAVATHRLDLAAGGLVLANGGAALLCLILSPKLKQPEKPPQFLPFLKNLAHFIGWSVASNLAYNAYGHLPPLILGALAGPGPVALFQAMRNFTQPLSTAATAVDNFDKPRAARAMAADGFKGLRRALGHTTTAMAVLTLPYCVLLIVLGDWLVAQVYGARYGDPTTTLAWFAACHVVIVAVYPLETAMFLLRRPDLLFWGRIGSAITGVTLCFLLVPRWGLGGAMAGITGGIAMSGVAAAFLLAREKPWLKT